MITLALQEQRPASPDDSRAALKLKEAQPLSGQASQCHLIVANWVPSVASSQLMLKSPPQSHFSPTMGSVPNWNGVVTPLPGKALEIGHPGALSCDAGGSSRVFVTENPPL